MWAHLISLPYQWFTQINNECLAAASSYMPAQWKMYTLCPEWLSTFSPRIGRFRTFHVEKQNVFCKTDLNPSGWRLNG